MLNIVVINGGRGAAALISALLRLPGVSLTSVVNAYDDGKSTGEIRRFFGMLGPSDIRKVQELMLPESDHDYLASLRLFQFRYPVKCEREAVIRDLQSFVSGATNEIVGVSFRSGKLAQALRRFVGAFLSGLVSIERVKAERFCFADCSIMNCIYAGAFLSLDRNIETAANVGVSTVI